MFFGGLNDAVHRRAGSALDLRSLVLEWPARTLGILFAQYLDPGGANAIRVLHCAALEYCAVGLACGLEL